MDFLTRQEIFDTAKNHLLYQYRKSEDEGVPKYFGPGDAKDPVGVFIHNEVYHSSIEIGGVSLLNHDSVIEKSYLGQVLLYCGLNLLNEKVFALLVDLQLVHDDFEPHQWHDALKEIAINHHLTF